MGRSYRAPFFFFLCPAFYHGRVNLLSSDMTRKEIANRNLPTRLRRTEVIESFLCRITRLKLNWTATAVAVRQFGPT